MDPLEIHTNCTARFSNTTGASSSRYEIAANAEAGSFGKGNTLGDIELILPLSPIEVGNRVWYDANDNGIQDAGENGFNGIIVELYDATGTTLLASATTDATGNFYFNNSNVTGGLAPNTSYILRVAASQFDETGSGPLAGLSISKYAITGNGAPGLSDNDASKVSGKAQISFTTGNYGQSNHNLDFGFTGIPLPLTLISFTAQLNNNNQVSLKWTTVTEVKVSHFVVERSTDGVHFNEEGIVFALYYGMEIMETLGVSLKNIRAGEANMFLSPVFRETFANVSGATVELYNTDGAQGAARGAGLGLGYYKNREDAFVGLSTLQTIEHTQHKKQVGLLEEVDTFEKELILDALKNTRGNRNKAAQQLKISERLLTYKVKKYAIDCEAFRR